MTAEQGSCKYKKEKKKGGGEINYLQFRLLHQIHGPSQTNTVDLKLAKH